MGIDAAEATAEGVAAKQGRAQFVVDSGGLGTRAVVRGEDKCSRN